ncbi:AAA family ATPase [Microcystis sp. M090S1]|uniref:ATP-dependent nuclease n=1 Tax=Microcystis sp. M090S1 TaxID=2771135 RepID=UPI002584B500|nr:AAA family ATPase [Microcystis sp. M090S1]
MTNRFIQNDRVNRQRLIDLFQSNTDIPLVAFDEDYFYEHFPRSWQSVDIFQQSLARIFVDYQRNWLTNRLKRVANLEDETVSFLTEEEFLSKYGEPPWEFVNSILETANLDFRINRPPQYEDRPYEPILTDRVRNSQVRFNDLSSGERILMSFALCLYYADDKNKLIVDNPKILLFDEIDAPLHPSMTQSLLRTIQDVLINRRNIKVILTTHSPSTVALAPEQSIYAMYKNEQKRMQKVTKDKALSILTTGVPTLSIDYENRRQVFVESRYDVQFYEKLHEKLKDYLTPEISLNFIASGGGNGTCDQVKDVVNQLKEGGNRTVYGIIDWDLKNCGNGRVKVLGKETRYSIENYILDPVLIAAFLLREKFIEPIEVGLRKRETYVDFGTFDDTRLQQIADFIVEKVKPKIQSEVQDDCLLCQYLSGKTIKLPKWFLRIQGHKLEEILKELFPKLNKFKKEPELKLEIISKVIDDFPSLIPYDILSLLKEVQDVK